MRTTGSQLTSHLSIHKPLANIGSSRVHDLQRGWVGGQSQGNLPPSSSVSASSFLSVLFPVPAFQFFSVSAFPGHPSCFHLPAKEKEKKMKQNDRIKTSTGHPTHSGGLLRANVLKPRNRTATDFTATRATAMCRINSRLSAPIYGQLRLLKVKVFLRDHFYRALASNS